MRPQSARRRTSNALRRFGGAGHARRPTAACGACSTLTTQLDDGLFECTNGDRAVSASGPLPADGHARVRLNAEKAATTAANATAAATVGAASALPATQTCTSCSGNAPLNTANSKYSCGDEDCLVVSVYVAPRLVDKLPPGTKRSRRADAAAGATGAVAASTGAPGGATINFDATTADGPDPKRPTSASQGGGAGGAESKQAEQRRTAQEGLPRELCAAAAARVQQLLGVTGMKNAALLSYIEATATKLSSISSVLSVAVPGWVLRTPCRSQGALTLLWAMRYSSSARASPSSGLQSPHAVPAHRCGAHGECSRCSGHNAATAAARSSELAPIPAACACAAATAVASAAANAPAATTTAAAAPAAPGAMLHETGLQILPRPGRVGGRGAAPVVGGRGTRIMEQRPADRIQVALLRPVSASLDVAGTA